MKRQTVMMVLAFMMSVGMRAQTGADASVLAESLRDQADSLYNAQQYDEAKTIALKGLNITSEQETRGDLLNLMAMINVRQGHFEQAAEYAKQCLELDLESGDPDMISSSYNTLTGIYMSMRQPKKAEKYILKAMEYADKVDNPQREAVLLGMASEVYHHLKQDELSLDYATRAYELERQLGRQDKMAFSKPSLSKKSSI